METTVDYKAFFIKRLMNAENRKAEYIRLINIYHPDKGKFTNGESSILQDVYDIIEKNPNYYRKLKPSNDKKVHRDKTTRNKKIP